ncbi:MAG: hypothetical protein KGZ94_06675 [Clostridia bacterium]|nr:hypothetical protein [Clostridia bacterium]
MKTIFKVALFHFGDYMSGVLFFLLGIVSIDLVQQYYMRVGGIESTVRMGGSFLIIVYAGYHSMKHFAFFQSWHLPRRQFYFANAVALFAMALVTLLIGPTLEFVLGAILPVDYDSIAETWFLGLDAVGVWAVLWSFSLHAFTAYVLWLLGILHYRGWFWTSIVIVAALVGMAMLSNNVLGVPLGSALGGALRFFFVGMIDGSTNIILASMNIALGALVGASACYLLLRREPIR